MATAIRLPRVRLTVRWVMVAVAVVASLLGLQQAWEKHNRRWATRYRKMADHYSLEGGRIVDDLYREHQKDSDWDPHNWAESEKRQWERLWEVVDYRDHCYWSDKMHQRAVWHPWAYLESNPVPPAKPWD